MKLPENVANALLGCDDVVFDLDRTLVGVSDERMQILRDVGVEDERCLKGVEPPVIASFMDPELLELEPPIREGILLYSTCLVAKSRIWFWTARWERLRSVTSDWLMGFLGVPAPVDRLLMRPDSATETSSVSVKSGMLRSLDYKIAGHKIVIFDDDQAVCDMVNDRRTPKVPRHAEAVAFNAVTVYNEMRRTDR
jgi:hypothetical protein